jgi:hypothetical protein
VRAEGGEPEQLTDLGAGVAAWRPRYSPDGGWILFSRIAGGASRLWAVPATGGAPVEVLPGGPNVYEFGIRPRPAP